MVLAILKDDDTTYRQYKPSFEFDLYNGEICYVAKVVVITGSPPPADVEISLSMSPEGPWKKVIMEKARYDEKNEFIMPGE